MHLYVVVSELIYHVEWEDWFNNVGHREDYRIAELVVAESHSQAKYLAWKKDNPDGTFPDIEDMPKFTCQKKDTGYEGPARVLDYEEWRQMDLPEGAWSLNRPAPQIGVSA